jgi:hypothetical protein
LNFYTFAVISIFTIEADPTEGTKIAVSAGRYQEDLKVICEIK